ncbi:ArsR/SmtB family transcription factor [Fimbriiglobus ruber]|uniref:HTH arsR-type domain-containing protein n=1 Tax=Fimbriiglobus ruber TaxID=1908690 RepID=A0A225D0Q8_9BACT|nr:metalloregulator ArsR/SmtB family transcription factor [Fimbriiglobus ruber]OWK35181.1 hypothetical protein FRUB_10023 [Fimbriiglobus ruber]
MTDFKQAEQCAKLFLALAEPSRIRIIDILRVDKKTVIDLAMLLKTEIVNVTHHLNVLHEVGLIQRKKFGRVFEYSLNPEMVSEDGAVYLDLGLYRVVLPAVE